MTKESLELLFNLLMNLNISSKDEKFVETAIAIDKAKREVKDELAKIVNA